MMPYPEFLLRRQAGAVHQLMLIGAVQVGMADAESAAIPIAMLRDVGGL